MKNYIIVGGGISGLLSAYLLKKKDPKKKVILIEKDQFCGGLLKSYHYPKGEGVFDYGVRLVHETGNLELDRIIKGFIPEDQWIELKAEKKDFGGTYYRGKLQVNSPFLDLRSFAQTEIREFIDDFFKNHEQQLKPDSESAYAYLRAKFGQKIADRVFKPIISKIYPFGLEDSYSFLAKLLPFDRIVLLDDEQMEKIMDAPEVRKAIAFPHQLKMPKDFVSKASAWYPKKYGMNKYVDAVTKKLTEMGVEIFTGSQVTSVKLHLNKQSRVEALIHNEKKVYEEIDEVIWTSGVVPCYLTLLSKKPKAEFDKPIKTCFVNVGLSEEPNVGGLYWFYCLDHGFLTHRIACPGSYCPDSHADGIHRISVEIMIGDITNPEEMVARVREEIVKMGITRKENILFTHLEMVSSGYPTLSIKNVNIIRGMVDEIRETYGDSLRIFGAWSKPELFSQADILNEVYQSLA